jgi:hypothetical protein
MKVQELIDLLQEAIANNPELAEKDIFAADSTALLEPVGVIVEIDKVVIVT